MAGQLEAALRETSCPSDVARGAVEEVAAMEVRVDRIVRDVRLLKWMTVLTTVLIIVELVMVFS
ncbi:MAG: hypothetical protein A4S12_12050 [Proteobacteria bacterium SG_bin5]|nr:hypothetical protein [Sphingomonas sp.]OQW38930.1 MAG: hypothetical protein A4S12_12050 [Proteobacteria bacterium SG_bin5]